MMKSIAIILSLVIVLSGGVSVFAMSFNGCYANIEEAKFEEQIVKVKEGCQSALKNDPPSASNFDPPQRVSFGRYS